MKHFISFGLSCLFLFLGITYRVEAQPRLPESYFWEKLANGLEVVVIENSKVPLVTIEIAVKNGAYTEGPEYSGLSHLFEHMFFKANKEYPDHEKFKKRTQELGAYINGTTGVERVNYYFTLHRDSLSGGLKFMNSAIRYPIYRTEDMKYERPVVDGEFQRAESDPSFVIWYESQKLLWGDLFIRKNPIGDHDIINTATPEKMKIIKDKYYHPNNSLLIICGDVKHGESFKIAEEIFGDWEHSGFNPHEKFPVPPFKPLVKNESFIKETSIAQTPFIKISWQGPGYQTDSAGTIAADVFSAILDLNASEFKQSLIDNGLATAASIFYGTTYFPGWIEINVMPNPNKLKECHEMLQQQIRRFTTPDYYSDAQLANAKAVLLRNEIRNLERPSSLASNLSYFWCSTSYEYGTDLISNYQKVTRADIQNYLQKYILNKPRVSGIILNQEINKQVNVKTFFATK
ncbi:M16 family metallopeptidase [Pedobacter immunditicola]|uniref:M16 family metallopeptidase n=1 Tax=Pedobacter immunditicola TaxID=3133440 RepID=UPI0030A709E5